MSYVVGVSSGAFTVTGAEEKQQLAGLFNKAQSSITKGVTFVQLDLESISEFEEPQLQMHMKEDVMKKLNIEFGIHSETKAFGVEASEMDSALETEYDRAQRRMIIILENSGKIGSKYVLIHSSESDPFPLLTLKTQPLELVDFYGRPLKEFLEKNDWLIKWFMEGVGKFMWVEILHGRTLDYSLEQIEKEFRDKYRAASKDISEEELKNRMEEAKKEYQDYFMNTVSSKALHYGPERWAYFLVAKWMEEKNDPLWTKIVDASIKFFAERDKTTPEQWLANRKIQEKSINDENFRAAQEIWVPAVSAKYIWGHMFPENPKYKDNDPKEIIKKYNMPLVLESPMGGRGIEEWLRLANPFQYYFLVEHVNKEAGFNVLMIGLDFEHMLSLRLDPELVIRLFPEDGGKLVNVIHAGWPSTLAPAHLPIAIGSDQQKYLYERYYELRQKGMGKDKEVYIVFERGGPETFQQSMISLKLIKEFLEKDIKPEDLIKKENIKFFGIDLGDMASTERQLTAIREHAYDPLKGLLMVPEEEHGVLGRAAVDRGKTEEWRKGRFR
jgi:hypothetical protein